MMRRGARTARWQGNGLECGDNGSRLCNSGELGWFAVENYCCVMFFFFLFFFFEIWLGLVEKVHVIFGLLEIFELFMVLQLVLFLFPFLFYFIIVAFSQHHSSENMNQ